MGHSTPQPPGDNTAALFELVRARRLTESELDLLSAGLPFLITRYSLSHRCIYVSQNCEQVTAKPRSWFMDRKLDQYHGYSADFISAIRQSIGRIIESKAVQSFETSLEKPWGTVRYIHYQAPEYDADGTLVSVISFAIDITEKHNSFVGMQRAVREQNHFLSMMAHELRNPLAALLSGLEALDRRPSVEVADRLRHIMHRKVTHITRLIDDLLDTARLETGSLKYQREVVSLEECLSLACQVTGPAYRSAGQSLNRDSGHGDILVNVDSCRISQALSNLLHNASKFSPRDSTIILKTSVEGEVAQIDIIDRGQGVGDEVRESIFNRYSRGTAECPLSAPGLGLGLHVAREVVRHHGGDVTVVPSEGQGATFRVTLPIEFGAVAQRIQHPPLARKVLPTSILIIDDNLAALETMKSLLELEGFSVSVAGTAREGESLFDELRPEVVCVDLGLPDDHGHAVARRIKARPEEKGGGRRTAVFALTGWGTERDRQLSLEAGCDAHLTKPVRFEDLLRLNTDHACAQDDSILPA